MRSLAYISFIFILCVGSVSLCGSALAQPSILPHGEREHSGFLLPGIFHIVSTSNKIIFSMHA